MTALLRRLALAALLCGACATAQAHRFHAGIADLSFNAQNASIEVVHTYMAHDVEALLAGLAGRPVDLTRPEDEALLRSYLERHFYLLDTDGKRLALAWVGMTASVDSVVVYQERQGTALDQVARVHNAVLFDVLPRQANTVNLRAEGQVRSLAFDAKTVERRIR
jgi:hypothetical protein